MSIDSTRRDPSGASFTDASSAPAGEPMSSESAEFDFIIVGSGAGGGPLAARLAMKGCRVLVLEAGSDHTRQPRSPAYETSQVPALHAVASEHPDLSWQFFVKHYDRPPTGDDPKLVDIPQHPGFGKIFYPRAAGIGGCTIHNAMITIAGPDSDWDDLADFLDDESWRSARMRYYFQRMEHNEYARLPTRPPTSTWGRGWKNLKWLFGHNADHTGGRHGFDGWLHTSVADVSLGLHDSQLLAMLKAALEQCKEAGLERAGTLVSTFVRGRFRQALDPNHSRTQAENPEGLAQIPIAVCGKRTPVHPNGETPDVRRGVRSSPRELLLEVKALHPDKLVIWTDCLVTKVLFDDAASQDGKPRAVGVEYQRGERLYRAHVDPSHQQSEPKRVYVQPGGEVILCGGSFNTPQLLMLSGIGAPEQLSKVGGNTACCLHDRDSKPLRDAKIGVRRVVSPGVGKNLQDRYEVTVISKMKHDFSLLNGVQFRLPDPSEDPDPALAEWRETGTGLYATNGAVLSIFKRSRPDLAQPDLFIFGVPAPFRGYALGYSKISGIRDRFTWTILKGQTNNHGGVVELRTADPRDTPDVNFHYFNELRECPNDDPDLLALLEGVKFVRGIGDHARHVVDEEEYPADEAKNDEDTKRWIRRVAWGHHACGTCRMGPDNDPLAVLDARFRVRGVDGLRVVDASIFPKIPGYFIVTNLYMASEKAADVIHYDFRQPSAYVPNYPSALRKEEAKAVRVRRGHAGIDAASAELAAGARGGWPNDVAGLALSGGGIRSATLNLGVLQALAQHHWLRRIDFLSTVSGGGYIGAFLGRLFDHLRSIPLSGASGLATQYPAEHVEKELADPQSRPILWLRKHGNYIAPGGRSDWRLGISAYLRSFLSVHFVAALLLFSLFGLANAIRYGLFDNVIAGLGLVHLGKGDLPLGHLLKSWLGPFFSPWFSLFELLLLFLVLPRIVGYWIVSQDQNQRFHSTALTLLFVVSTVLLFLGVHERVRFEPLVVGLALLSSFIPVELAWRRGRIREEALGSGGAETQRMRTRNYLTYDLGLALAIAGFALAFALIDTAGHGLQQWVARNVTYVKAFAALGAALAALTPIVRLAATVVTPREKSGCPPSTERRILRQQIMAGLLALVLLALPLVAYSFSAHAAYRGGADLVTGLSATLLAIVLTVILRFPRALAFVNRSSLTSLYSSRLARAYLGASNPLRQRPDGANITEVIGGDDVATICDYRPHEAGGPLHLINLVVNQTVDFTSQRGKIDRQGENVAVSCLGMSVGQRWHSLWENPRGHLPGRPHGRRQRLQAVGHVPGDEHPLIDETGESANFAEMLSLRDWIGISGAAIGPGRGQNTALGTALLFGLANLRTGYWWDSGIDEAARDGFPHLTFLRRLLFLLPEFFRTQALLIFEWVAWFPGPWQRFWNLSDGGFFENLGAYELVRRRIPRIIVSDASADPTYAFDSFAEFVRKVRIDFDAQVTPFTEETLDQHVPHAIRPYVGTPSQLRPDHANPVHATLYWIDYPQPADAPLASAQSAPRRSVLLYLKASITGDEDDDIRNYRSRRQEFPHEATTDQVFDEAQWESYRKLGNHMADRLLSDPNWLWKIPV